MMPNPPRTNVRPSSFTSHEKEMRGEMLFRSFLRLPLLRYGCSSVELASSGKSVVHGTVNLLFSVLISASYRRPRLSVKFGTGRHSSFKYAPVTQPESALFASSSPVVL